MMGNRGPVQEIESGFFHLRHFVISITIGRPLEEKVLLQSTD